MGEFELIERFFKRPVSRSPLGIGDDCALLAPAPGMQLAVSTDMLVEGRHFFAGVDPARLGHKALAVNLSDLAACGARPLAFSLALALPNADERWLAGFSRGLFALADLHGCELVGGDTTQGPLNICITVFGEVPAGQALLRSGAQVGDDLYVSGSVGDARLALEGLRGHLSVPRDAFEAARARLEQPTPRVALGLALRGIATSAIDISDGLLGDLGHVLTQSRVGARVEVGAALALLAAGRSGPSPGPEAASRWPRSSPAGAPPESVAPAEPAPLSRETRLGLVFAGGDDYELVFTAPASARAAVEAAAASCATPVTRIGAIEAAPGLRLLAEDGTLLERRYASFDHFA